MSFWDLFEVLDFFTVSYGFSFPFKQPWIEYDDITYKDKDNNGTSAT